MERFIRQFFLPRIQELGLFGPRQFAYSKGRSYKDTLAICVCEWIWAFGHRCHIGLYCSDVAGAFDKVSSKLLVKLLSTLGIHQRILNVLSGWLECRSAFVIVDNTQSHHF